MNSRHWAAAAFVAFVLALGAAAAAQSPSSSAPAPLRTLTYDVAYSLETQQDMHVSGLTGGQPHGRESGRAAVQRGFSSNDRGTVSIEVIAAPKDGTLVVDASYAGREANQTPIRIAIYPDGSISFDPKRTMVAQVRQVVPLLARGMLAERDLSPGASWSTPAPRPAKGDIRYRVTQHDGTRAVIATSADLLVAGPDGYDQHDDATMTYATDVLCPVSYDLRRRVRRQLSAETLESTDSRLTVTLLTDSFRRA